MVKRIWSLALIVCICFMIVGNPVVSYASNADEEFQDEEIQLAPKSEYQMALEATRQNSDLARTGSRTVTTVEQTPLDEFKEAFDERAEMDVETLSAMGYSDSEISILKAYVAGECTFAEAASRASAVLTPTLTCLSRSKTKYIFKYSWVWDKVPSGLKNDAFAVAFCGINSQSIAFDSKVDSSIASVSYYYVEDYSLYTTVYPSTSANYNCVSAQFATYKLSDDGNSWVWAKRGYMTVTISPTVSGSNTYTAVRVLGEYAHTSTTISISVSASVDLKTGYVSISFGPTTTTDVVTYGSKQIVFYTDGSYIVEG